MTSPAFRTSTPRSPQAGLTLIELLVAAFFSLIVVGLAGKSLLSNLRSYTEIKKTLAMQTAMKRSLQAMTRQISNTGGWMANPRSHFKAAPDRITFAYFDVESRFCSSPDTLVASFYTRKTSHGTVLVEEHKCSKGESRVRTLAESPLGGSLTLRFSYLDANGAATLDPARIRAVRLDLGQKRARQGATTSISRSQSLQVEMVNL